MHQRENKRTIIIKVNPEDPEDKKIEKAADVIRKGGLVAFPTETVYGLGANALDKKAVVRIFKAKGRPMDNPLIVHVSDMKMVNTIAEMNYVAEKLAREFFPGPITLIVDRKETVPPEVTAGLKTVAIRMPSHQVALKLIKMSGTPIAAPSANLAGKPSPTKAEHVIDDLYGKIDLIIDGGETNIGLESTVVDTTTYPVEILRPGGLPIEEIKKVVDVKPLGTEVSRVQLQAPKSPGMKYRHYAPEAELIVLYGRKEVVVREIKRMCKDMTEKGLKVGIVATKTEPYLGIKAEIVELGNEVVEVARKLFSSLRELDKRGVDVILAEGVEERDLGVAVMNRLRKASHRFYRV